MSSRGGRGGHANRQATGGHGSDEEDAKTNLAVAPADMPVSYTSKAAPNAKVNMQLKTADQYELWFSRVSDATWASTRKILADITDASCAAAEADAQNPEKVKAYGYIDWVPIVWILETSALSNEIYLKVSHRSDIFSSQGGSYFTHGRVVPGREFFASGTVRRHHG